ncbi:MAG TPA: hypothetical protein VMU16_13615 [Candidatus Binataceae bacterium]|nr:hypothetical protein [Candidatus Binataceae bacterium]
MDNDIAPAQQRAFPRLLRAVEPPLALYLRSGRNDHIVLAQSLTEGLTGLRGIIFDPGRPKPQQELRDEADRRGVETVLDPRMIELASEMVERRKELAGLDWAFAGRKGADELKTNVGKEAARKIAAFVVNNGFSAVVAPTHYLNRAEDPWVSADCFLTSALRDSLDTMGATEIPVYYPLALPSAIFRNSAQRKEILRALRDVPIDSIWLRIHPFGTTASGPIALTGYIEGCQEFHQLKIPLVAERTGTVGIALLSFGAVGGIESGITTGESFNAIGLTRPPNKGKAFLPPPRVYVKELGAFLSVEQARAFFSLRGMKAFFGCRESCCTRGVQDTLDDPRRHFIVTRAREVARISSVPVTRRRQIYLEEIVRPATDLALQASRVFPALDKQRRRVESWRGTLGAVERENPLQSWSEPPNGRRVVARHRASAE